MSAPVAAPNGSAAAAISTSSSAPVASSSSSGSKPAIQPSEVGWLFVPQYYTFLNQNPSRLHCFYTKKSTLIHGTEQEDASPRFGQQQIHEKISSLGFQDAKVFVSNVDSQSSASGGILIQVLGEMSNKGGPWRKFAQTFFLAEQPNGYFVLNDIFRYLKDDDEVEQEAEDIDEAIQNEIGEADKAGTEVVHQAEVNNIGLPTATPHIPSIQSLEAANGASTPAISDAPGQDGAASTEPTKEKKALPEAAAPSPVDTAQATGTEAEPTKAAKDEVGMNKKVTVVPAEEVSAVKPPAAGDKQADAPRAESTAPAAEAPKPKTWANLAASNVGQWGSTVSAESKGVSSARPAPAAVPTAAAPKAAPSAGAKGSTASSGNSSIFIKNVTDRVKESDLKATLESQFGPLKECLINAAKQCAFAEFVNSEHAKKAVAKQNVAVGKEGVSVLIEERKRQAERGPQGAGRPNAGRGGAGGGAQRGGASNGAPRGGATRGTAGGARRAN